MDILYKNKTAKQKFSSECRSKWKYPAQVAEKLLAAETYIQQAASLQDIFSYPPYRFHALKGDRKGEWSISLGGTGYRVTLIPCDSNGKPVIGGDVLMQCRSIKIIMVTEVSNHYE